MSVQNEISRLNAAKADLAAALAEQGASVPGGARLEEFPALVRGIERGTDTGDADATAADIAKGKTAYVKGERVTGVVPVSTSHAGWANRSPSINGAGDVQLTGPTIAASGHMWKQGGAVWLSSPLSNFGDAQPEDVASGRTFTSAAGLKAVGTAVISTGPVYRKDVNFLDYDGTCLYSYTLEEAQALTELPPLPAHGGLVCQGWNWSLAEIKALGRAVDVGAMYITDDGKTRLYIHLETAARNVVPLYWSQIKADGVTIDWGDGSAAETFEGTGSRNTTHTYGAAGDYVITLDSAEQGMNLGTGDQSYSIMGSTAENGKVYCNMLRKVEVGGCIRAINSYAFNNCGSLSSINIPYASAYIDSGVFKNCYALSYVVVPNSTLYIMGDAFNGCHALSNISLPKDITRINSSAFRDCYSLSGITIPPNVVQIEGHAFENCYSLSGVTIPNSVAEIHVGSEQFVAATFRNCYGMKEVRMLSSIPPELGTNVFDGIPSDCIIYVPRGCLEAYQTATNWSTYAGQMQEEPQT